MSTTSPVPALTLPSAPPRIGVPRVDWDVMMSILILHDVDKPLMYTREGASVGYSQLSRELPHGVVGAMLLKELGFPHTVVSTVATHAGNAPFHGSNLEAYVLHYGDYFSADQALMFLGPARHRIHQKPAH